VSLANVVPKGLPARALPRVVPSVLSLLSLAVVARYLSPEEFGIATIVLAFVQILTLPIERLFHRALVQRHQISTEHVDTAFTFTLTLAVGLCAACQVLGATIVTEWQQPLLGNLLRWTSLSLLGTGFGSVLAALLRRRREFRALALASLGGAVGSTTITIAVVVQGGGVYALAIQQVALACLTTLTLWLLPHERPRVLLHAQAARELTAFGVWPRTRLAAAFITPRLFLLLVGMYLGQASAGIFGLALRCVDAVRDLVARSSNIANVASGAPFVDATHFERPSLYRSRTSAIRLITLVVFPLFAVLATFSRSVIGLVFGSQWVFAAPYLSVISLMAIPDFMRSVRDVALTGTSEPDRTVAARVQFAVELTIVVVGMAVIGRESTWLALLVWFTRLAVSLALEFWIVRPVAVRVS
jgi:PST family polysaccharide transporter